ncbi:MAG TPA: beta-ketoacyl-ACP synthase III, partial [Gaiellales bacterium]|nr:beta-ketoacyl-ACP synthase III [Gaiellales bacterium]
SADLGFEASLRALENASIPAQDLDLIVAATASPDYYFPATASLIGERLGANDVASFDLSAACTGFIYALAQAYSQIAAGLAETVLVVGTEVFSRLLDWSDRSTCILFGDGAGAVVLRRDDDRHGLRGFELGADGSGALLLSVAAAGHAADHDEGPFVQMNGPEVYKFATRVVVDSSLRSLEAAGLGVEDVDVFVPHQANRRIIDHAARRLGLDDAKVFSNVDRYGNTSAGSIPICLDEAWRQGRIRPGDVVLMVGFGGGLAWGSCVMEWTKERA